MSKPITISEIFGPTIQGEGKFIGQPTVFVRIGGCDYRCSWCDTLYAVLPEYKSEWKPMSAEDIMWKVQNLSPYPILITLSGGNPAIQPLKPLLDLGHARGYTFCMETQGSTMCPWLNSLDYLTVSPKPPSSGMTTNWERLDHCVSSIAYTVLKVVVFNDRDYAYAREVEERYPDIPLYLQAGNETVGNFDLATVLGKLEWLINKVTTDHWNEVTVLPQLHTLLWGNKRGV